jgi:hypothetical protein
MRWLLTAWKQHIYISLFLQWGMANGYSQLGPIWAGQREAVTERRLGMEALERVVWEIYLTGPNLFITGWILGFDPGLMICEWLSFVWFMDWINASSSLHNFNRGLDIHGTPPLQILNYLIWGSWVPIQTEITVVMKFKALHYEV